jgi:TctA family transporter
MTFLEAAVQGWATVLAWPNLIYPVVGTLLAMVAAFLPGLSGVTIMAMALPFTLTWEPIPALLFFAALVGGGTFMGSVTAILFNVPGSSPSAATLIDGYPMARNGEARTAIACSAAASALGSTFGIVILVLLLPFVRALLLGFGPPEFLMLTVWGLATVAMLGRDDWLKGLAAAGIGLSLALVGRDPQTAEDRYTLGLDYLQDGLTIVPVLLGLFAVAETIEMMASPRPSIAGELGPNGMRGSIREGIAAVWRNWGLFLRSSAIGTVIGAIPGVGGTVASFIAYGHAVQSSPHPERFGKGDVRGVLAPEAAHDAKDGGSLLPVLAFGIPGSEGTVLLLVLFEQHGIVPGRELMSAHLPLVFALIWALFLSNWITSLVGLAVSGPLARITVLRTQILAPIILCLAAIGAVATRGLLGDLVVAAAFGLLGYLMRRHGWSRVPLAIGFVLGAAFEANLLLTLRLQELGRINMLERPVVLGLALLILATLLLPAWRRGRVR